MNAFSYVSSCPLLTLSFLGFSFPTINRLGLAQRLLLLVENR
jgi:hypothetical protein